MAKKSRHSLWNIKDIIILQFSFFLIREFVRWGHDTFITGDGFVNLLFPVIGQLLFLAVVFFWLFFLYQVPPPYLGLTLEKLKSGSILGLKLGIPLVLLVIFLINFPMAARESPQAFSPVYFISNAETLATSFLYLALLGGILFLPALGTELYFRGIITGYFHRKWGSISAAFFSSIFFALFWGAVHPGWFIFHFILGLALYYLYVSRESLWPGVIYLTFIQAGLTLYAVGWDYLNI